MGVNIFIFLVYDRLFFYKKKVVYYGRRRKTYIYLFTFNFTCLLDWIIYVISLVFYFPLNPFGQG